MKICVYGAGGVGGHLACRMAAAGFSVSVVARGEHLSAIQRHGLRLRESGRTQPYRVQADSDPGRLGPHDIVFLCTKAYSLEEVAQQITPLLHSRTIVASTMNGIPWWYYYGVGGKNESKRIKRLDPSGLIWRNVDPARVVGVITRSFCKQAEPGLIEIQGGLQPVDIGEPDSCADQSRLRLLGDVLRRSGLEVRSDRPIRDAIWSKLVLNMGSGAMSILLPQTLKEIYSEPACLEARARIGDELQCVARAAGCKIDVDLVRSAAIVKTTSHRPSIGQDVDRGRRIEMDAMLLAPLDIAREHEVSTPTLDILVTLAKLKAQSLGLY